jgi:hypothetical protein
MVSKDDGSYREVTDVALGAARQLFSAGGELHAIEWSGTLFRLDLDQRARATAPRGR